MRLYLSGPMTGIENYNYPALNAAAANLRAQGFHVQNPAENPARDTWEEYMRMAIRQMLICDAVVVLAGWKNSKGATEEVRVAGVVGMDVYSLNGKELRPIRGWFQNPHRIIKPLVGEYT